MNGLLNPWMAMGTGLLSAGGPHLDPSKANLGAGLSAGLNNLAQFEQLAQREKLANERLRLAGRADSRADESHAMAREKFESSKGAAAQEQKLRGLLAEQIAQGDKKGAAATLGLLGEVKEATGLLGSGGFEGTSMDAQMLSIVNEVGALQASGQPIPPELQRRFELAKWHLMQPRPSGIDPITGQQMMTAPPPLPSFGQQAPQQPTRQVTPQASMPGEPALSDVMGNLPRQPPQPVQASRPDPSGGILGVLDSMSPGDFLSKDQLIELDFPADAKVQVIGSRGGVRSLKVLDAGTKQGAEAKRMQDKMGLVETVGHKFLELAKANQGDVGPIEGRITRGKSNFGMGSRSTAMLTSMEAQMKSMLGTALSGAAIPATEWPTYQAMLPSVNDNMDVMEGKVETYDVMIQTLEDIAAGKKTKEDLAAIVGGDVKPTKILKFGSRR